VISLVASRLPDASIEHVGSSSVPGCAGKGYLDFVIPYRNAEHLAAIDESLFALGFGRQRNRDPFPESRPMRTGAFDFAGRTFLLQVHVVPDASREAEAFREFRDRLRADPVLVEEYVALKRSILAAGVQNGDDYARRKGAFFAEPDDQGAERAR
jgi:GrpB-like predicted nucleotidyltransferase (UPF0157 family)